MKGFVLAAGEGRRMRPLSTELPKPLLPLLGVSQLAWTLTGLAEGGIREVWVNASTWASERIFGEATANAARLGLSVKTSHEREGPLGTAGALMKVRPLGEPLVVVNADVACDLPIAHLIEAHRSARAEATLLAIPSEERADLVVEEGWVVETIDRSEELRWGHTYGGIGVFEPEVLRFVPEGASGLFESVMRGLVSAGSNPAALVWHGYWAGIDTPRDHLEANLDVLAGAMAIPEGLPQGEVVGDLVYLGKGAAVEGGDIRHSVLGPRAKVLSGVVMDRCVVWEGVEVDPGEYRDSILTPTQVVRT